MTRYLLIAVLFLFAANISAQDNGKLFVEANKLYEKGNFKQAAAKYEEIIANGYRSPEIYFNLGNTYYRMNEFPRAIINFERAKRLDPSDEDIDFNLHLAELKSIDKIESVPSIFFMEWYYSLRSQFASSAWSSIALVFEWLAFAALVLFIIHYKPYIKKLAFGAGVVLILVSVVCMVIAWDAYKIENTRNEAVVFSPSVYVKSSPDNQSKDLFILHEGTKVKILDSVGEWKRIKLANGNDGWLDQNAIEVI